MKAGDTDEIRKTLLAFRYSAFRQGLTDKRQSAEVDNQERKSSCSVSSVTLWLIISEEDPMTPEQFRKLVLSFDGSEEHAHHRHPDFRVNGRIFSTLGYPDDARAMVKLTPEQQAEFVHDFPEVFSPASGKWGLNGATSVHLPKARKAEISHAVEAAWKNALAAPSTRSNRKSVKR
jgi:hypothetical protein